MATGSTAFAASSETNALLGGVVVDRDGVPIEFAWLTLRNAERQLAATTDARGTWQISEVPPGTYSLRASAFGFATEVYDDLGCEEPCDPFEGTPIILEAGDCVDDLEIALTALGRIEGSVGVADPSRPGPLTSIFVLDPTGETVYSETIGSSYSIALPAGQYYVAVGEDLEVNLLGELYSEVPCLGPPFDDCPLSEGELVTVVDESVVTGIDFTLDTGAVITGTVEGANGVLDQVLVYDEEGDLVRRAAVRDDETYRAEGLLAGTYYAVAERSDLFDPFTDRTLYRERSCEICDPLEGDPIEVSAGQVTEGIDFTFVEQASLQIEVVDASTGEELPMVVRRLFDDRGRLVSDERVAPGRYYAAAGATDYQAEAWDDAPLDDVDLDPQEILAVGTPIDLASGENRTLRIALEPYGVLAGRVVDEAGAPIAGMVLRSYGLESGRFFGLVVSAVDGSYELPAPPEPSLLIADPEIPRLPQAPTIFPSVPCVDVDRLEELCAIGGAATLEVELGERLQLGDFVLAREAILEVRAEDAVTGEAIRSFTVSLFLDDGNLILESTAFDAQTYRRLPAGGYRILANAPGYVPSAFGATRCGAGCGVFAGEVIELVGRETRVIVVSLFRPQDEPGLFLRDNRFRIDARWTDFDGNRGDGIGLPLTDESGYFWFFADDNVEVVIKVLDACEAFGRFWVFAAGLTNVGVEIDVTDRLYGSVSSYSSPLGVPFQPILDTDAFECVPGVARGSSAPAPAVDGRVESLTTKVGEPLSLRGGRFVVETTWRDFDGNTGVGTGADLTRDSGTFWFFDPSNVEVIVKVLDACDAFGRYWVFAAGLTNIEVSLTMTDTDAAGDDVTIVYDSPLGTPFQPILDVDAFATCP